MSAPNVPVAAPATPQLTLANVLYTLGRHLDDLKSWQILDHAHPDYGALVNPGYGMADNKVTSGFVTAAAYFLLGTGKKDPELMERVNLAAASLLAAQRPSGLIDLPSVNYDSSPDTGFTVQQLCTIFELGQDRAQAHPQWAALLQKLETFIRRAVPGMLTGGFHTPNHRWVIASALAQAKALFPDLDVASVVEAYLAEGIDIDAEGAFIERSVGVYDAVNNRSLLFLHENWECPEALAAVQRSLHFDLHLLHADGTAETGLSRRQDYGAREVPIGLASCFLRCHAHAPEPVFVRAAQTLWANRDDATAHILWLTYALLRWGDPAQVDAQLPADFSRYFPHNGIWRVRRSLRSASFFQGVTRLLTFIHGRAELSSLKISLTYFGGDCGRFISDEMDVAGNRAVLHSTGRGRPRRPGYELPLGRPVPPAQWQASFAQRGLRQLPPLASELTIEEVSGGFDLHYRTLDGLERVAAQIAFDFPPGGVWETADTRLQPKAGQVLFLKQGDGTMRYGSDAIRIGPGALAHSMWQMREAETAPDHVRVLLTFLTPVDHRFTIRSYRGLTQPQEARG